MIVKTKTFIRYELSTFYEGEKALTRYRGINVGWKKIQHHIGHFLVLVEYVSIALSHKRKKIINQFFSN